MEDFDLRKYLIESRKDGKVNEGYTDEKVAEIGQHYREFQKYLGSLNYEDLMEYAEKSQEWKTLEILEFLKQKSKYI